MELPGTIWVALFLVITVLVIEVFNPKLINEGFTSIVGIKDGSGSDTNNFFAPLILRRGDIGLNKEEANYSKDPRYFAGYVDVQNYGLKHDYCRMVIPGGDEKKMFFACALAGTSGLTSVAYKTKDVSQGLQLSRDDYMNNSFKENNYAYCRIIKDKDGTFQPLCLRAKDTSFADKNEVDPNPPQEIVDLLDFYDGCVVWLRLRDDMVDYTKSLTVQKGGAINIPEDPNPDATRGLSFNGIDQFLRISDAPDLTLGRTIHMRSIRAFSTWVYFDSFTNNAHIFDFGDGPGNNNTVLSILGKGDESTSAKDLRPMLCGKEQPTLPDYPSGPHPCKETSPQNLMLLKANVNMYECALYDKDSTDSHEVKEKTKATPTKATLLYEVWDAKQRKMRCKVNAAISLKKWTHIVISANSNDSFRPDIIIYVDGVQVFVENSGHLPQATSTTNNYLGKSNWSNATSQYELKDELFNGKIFDFRMYNKILGERKINNIIAWGKDKLAIK